MFINNKYEKYVVYRHEIKQIIIIIIITIIINNAISHKRERNVGIGQQLLPFLQRTEQHVVSNYTLCVAHYFQSPVRSFVFAPSRQNEYEMSITNANVTYILQQ
jgi:hypothetical protein